jgi:hypothetical protein
MGILRESFATVPDKFGENPMKTFTTLAALLVLVASSAAATAATGHALSKTRSMEQSQSAPVIVDGQYIGQDPDPNVRAELRRDSGEYLGND